MYTTELISSTYGLLALDVLKSYFPASFNNSPTAPLDARHLTREYYSLEIARLISRDIGLHLLREMKEQREIRTDGRALINALYVIQCFHPRGMFLSLNRLHVLGQRILGTPLYSTMTVSEQCQLILTTMQSEKFLPAKGGSEYYDIDNSFLYATFDGKPTIPLTLVSIFCALAEECGLTARPIGFPGEVMAQVDQPASVNVPPLIVSIFDSKRSLFCNSKARCSSLGKIVTLAEINERLSDVLHMPLSHPLTISPIIELVIRSARNMINCITRYSNSSLNPYGLYAAVSVLKILGGGALPFAFDSMMNVLSEHFPMDIRFFELLSSPVAEASADLRRLRAEDSNPPAIPTKRRSSAVPKFCIGQIFRHAQFDYWAVICGWDLTCTASALWQVRMGIASLTRGASQPFYHIVANDSSRRYVAEDNINISPFTSLNNAQERDTIIENLCNIDGIGRYFERVDVTEGRFFPVTELSQGYPDDYL